MPKEYIWSVDDSAWLAQPPEGAYKNTPPIWIANIVLVHENLPRNFTDQWTVKYAQTPVREHHDWRPIEHDNAHVKCSKCHLVVPKHDPGDLSGNPEKVLADTTGCPGEKYESIPTGAVQAVGRNGELLCYTVFNVRDLAGVTYYFYAEVEPKLEKAGLSDITFHTIAPTPKQLRKPILTIDEIISMLLERSDHAQEICLEQ